MKKSIDNYKQQFLDSLKRYRGYSELTVKTYADVLDEAFQFIEITEESQHIVWNLMPYRIHIAKLNAKTISKKLSAIRSFSEFVNEEGLHVTLQADESIKVAKTLPKPVAHGHIVAAMQKCNLQEKLLVVMLYTLGLRISELASLELKNISNEWIRVIGKGNKQRDIPLLQNTRTVIDEYLSVFIVKKFLFEKNGERLSENSLRYMITKIFKRVALKVTPHQLRHSYASSLLNAGAPIVDVSELLGHASMATTQIYTKLGSALKQQNYNKAHPLGDSEC